MIPRTKVNYSFRDLLRALLITEGGQDHRRALLGELQELLGEGNVVLTPSGRGALYFLLKTCARSRVLVPSYTCKAVVEAACLAGKEVVFVKSSSENFNASADAFERHMDGNAIVLATHQYGIPCDIERIVDLARKKNALVVEDAAGSLGTKVNGRWTGTLGDAGFVSFDSTKLINVPMKGGFLLVKDPAWAKEIEMAMAEETRSMPRLHKIRLLVLAAGLVLIENHLLYRVFHSLMFQARGRYTNDGPGLKLELDGFYIYALAQWQAWIAYRQVRKLGAIIEKRREDYQYYLTALRGCGSFLLPPPDIHGEWACIRFPIQVKEDKLRFYARAARRGLDAAFSFSFLAPDVEDPAAHEIATSVLNLPFYFQLSRKERSRTVDILREMDQEILDEAR